MQTNQTKNKKDNGRNNTITIVAQPLLVDTIGAAKMLCISPEYLRQLDRAGKLPLPINKFGRRKLWSVQSLTQWVSDGCVCSK